MKSQKIIKILQQYGWYKVDQDGTHIQIRHQDHKGRVTVPQLRQIDAVAKKHGMSRSSFIVHAAKNAIDLIQTDKAA